MLPAIQGILETGLVSVSTGRFQNVLRSRHFDEHGWTCMLNSPIPEQIARLYLLRIPFVARSISMKCHEEERLRHLALSSVVRVRSDVEGAVWRVLGQPESRVYHLGRGGPRWKDSGMIAALCDTKLDSKRDWKWGLLYKSYQSQLKLRLRAVNSCFDFLDLLSLQSALECCLEAFKLLVLAFRLKFFQH